MFYSKKIRELEMKIEKLDSHVDSCVGLLNTILDGSISRSNDLISDVAQYRSEQTRLTGDMCKGFDDVRARFHELECDRYNKDDVKFISKSDAALRGVPVADALDLTVRASKRLRYAGIQTLGQLLDKTPGCLMGISGFGRHSLNDVVSQLEQIGLELKSPD